MLFMYNKKENSASPPFKKTDISPDVESHQEQDGTNHFAV